ncbi:hypothetical protein ACFY8N_10335 [Streptomyces collinus]|uniref:hypothetical protein n=1 Tax=Streptomyces collinus TaxID=42684 RepID=UPI00367A2185
MSQHAQSLEGITLTPGERMQHGLIAMPVTGGCDKDIDGNGERGFGRPAVSAHAQSQVIEVHRQFDARVRRRMRQACLVHPVDVGPGCWSQVAPGHADAVPAWGDRERSRIGGVIRAAQNWGEVLWSTSMPRVGSGWTDTGESFDTRGLKKRARKATRPVPIPPVLVRLIREHIKEFGTGEDGRLFRAAQGGHLLSKEYGEA